MMKTYICVKTKVTVLLLLMGLSSFFYSAYAQPSHKNGTIKERRFQRLMDKENTVLVDVRTIEEYQAGHIPHARLLDVQQPAFMDSLKTLDKNKTYLLYCRSGKRSQKVVNLLKENGFKRVYHLKGGYSNWKGDKE